MIAWLRFGLAPELERRYRESQLASDLIQAKICVLMLLVPLIAFLIVDYDFVGLSLAFYGYAACRIAVVAGGVILLRYLTIVKHHDSYDRAIFIWELLLLVSVVGFGATRPQNYIAHSVVIVIGVFVTALVIPNKFINQIVLSLTATLGEMIVILLYGHPTSFQSVFTVLSCLFLANAIAISTSWHLHLWRRQTFAACEKTIEAEHALYESEARFRGVFEGGRIGVVIAGQDGRIIEANQPFLNIVGYDIDELRSMTFAELTHPDDIESELACFDRALSNNSQGYDSEKRYIKKDGEVVWVYLHASVMTGTDGKAAFAIGMVEDITERKQVEKALQDSEERYHSLFDSMTEGFALHEIICDDNDEPCDYRFIDINPAFEHLTGLKREDVIGATHNNVLPNDDPKWIQTYGEVALTGKSIHFTNYSPALNRHYEVFSYCPAPHLFAVMFADITERKQTEQALEKYRILARNSRDIILFVDLEGRIIEANNAAESAYGYSRDELLALTIFDLRASGVPDMTIAQMAEADSSGILFEAKHRRKDGSCFEVEVSSRGTDIEGQRILLSVIRDISSRKLAEQALKDSEMRFRALANEMPHFVWETDTNGIPIYANQRFLDYCSLTFEQARDGGWIDAQHPDDSPKVEAAWRQAITNCSEYDEESRFYNPTTNQYRWFRIKGSPVRDDENRIQYWVGTCTDIEETKQAEEALIEAKREAERRADEAEEARSMLGALMDYIPEGITVASAPDVLTLMTSKYGDSLLTNGLDSTSGLSMESWLANVEHYLADGLTPAKTEDLPLWRAVKKGETVKGMELVLRRPNGEFLPIICNAGPIRDQEGNIRGGIVAWRDITERKLAEMSLLESESREKARAKDLQTVLDAVPVAVWIAHDPECKQITGNAYADECATWWQCIS